MKGTIVLNSTYLFLFSKHSIFARLLLYEHWLAPSQLFYSLIASSNRASSAELINVMICRASLGQGNAQIVTLDIKLEQSASSKRYSNIITL